jgi:hypothetical protein
VKHAQVNVHLALTKTAVYLVNSDFIYKELNVKQTVIMELILMVSLMFVELVTRPVKLVSDLQDNNVLVVPKVIISMKNLVYYNVPPILLPIPITENVNNVLLHAELVLEPLTNVFLVLTHHF